MPKGVYERKHWSERFWEKVDKHGPLPSHRPELGNCWVWIASVSRGYGQFWLDGEQWKSHRVSWMLEHGSIDDTHLMHRCDNPLCVRPSHLQKGTLLENNADRDAKWRQAHSERSGTSKGTPQEILSITDLYFDHKWTQEELAEAFDRTQASVSQILRGVAWKHLDRRIMKGRTVRRKK
jgi:hypothetical protein